MNKIKKHITLITIVVIVMASFIPFATQADPVEFLYGDINNDQKITAGDALTILQYSVNKITLSDIQIEAAKVGNKATVSAGDALLVLQASVQKITPDDFPSGRTGSYNPVESSNPDSSDPVSSVVSEPPESSEPDSSEPISSVVSEPLELTPVSQEDYWSYNQLSNVQKDCYNKIVEGVSERTTDYIIMGNTNTIDQSDVRFAYFAVQKDHPEFFYMPLSYIYLTQGNNVYITIYYNQSGNIYDYYLYSAEDVAEITPLLKDKIQDIYDEVLTSGMSQYDMALALHNWIVNNATYHDEAAADPASYPEAWSAANVLLGEHKGVCEGLSRAYQLLLYNCGINSTLVNGEGGGGAHMWNLVELDGNWYETDITWDDRDEQDHPFYFFYNQTTDVMNSSHTRSVNLSDVAPEDFITIKSFNYNIPVCTATQNNYFVKSGLLFLNASEFKEKAPALIAENVEQGKNYLDVMISGEVFNSAADTGDYVDLDLIIEANELINPPNTDIQQYGVSITPGACGFTIRWS